jgi:hypothetical protein
MALGIVVRDVGSTGKVSLGEFGAEHILMVSGLGATVNPYQKTSSARPATPSSMWKKGPGAAAANTPRPMATASVVNNRAEGAVAAAGADNSRAEKLRSGLASAREALTTTTNRRKQAQAKMADLTAKTALINHRANAYSKEMVAAAKKYDRAQPNSAKSGAATKAIGTATLKAKLMTKGAICGAAKADKTVKVVGKLTVAEARREAAVRFRTTSLAYSLKGRVDLSDRYLNHALDLERQASDFEDEATTLEKVPPTVTVPPELSKDALVQLTAAVKKVNTETDDRAGYEDQEDVNIIFMSGLGLTKAQRDAATAKSVAENKAKQAAAVAAKKKAADLAAAKAKQAAAAAKPIPWGDAKFTYKTVGGVATGGEWFKWAPPVVEREFAGRPDQTAAMTLSTDWYNKARVEFQKKPRASTDPIFKTLQAEAASLDKKIDEMFAVAPEAPLTPGEEAAASGGMSTGVKVGIGVAVLAVVGGAAAVAMKK